MTTAGTAGSGMTADINEQPAVFAHLLDDRSADIARSPRTSPSAVPVG